MSKLMYIFADREIPMDRVEIVQGLGYDVVAVDNYAYKTPKAERKLLDALQECDGLWMDLAPSEASLRTTRLVFAADEAGKRLLGHIDTVDRVSKSIINFIGLPERTEA